MRRTVLISVFLAACPSVCFASPQDEAIKTALAHCLNNVYGNVPSPSASIPPGLIEGQNVHAVALPGGQAFSYEGTKPRVLSCGVAVYGAVSPPLLQQIRQMINASGRKQNSADVYQVSAAPADKSYWGSGINGVLMLVRAPGPDAPALEVEYHSLLVP